MKVISSLVGLVLAAGSLFGQGANATITGTVADPSGAIIANATIRVRNVGTGQVYVGASSTTGNYSILQLPPGRYDLTVEVAGFKTFTHQNFGLSAAQVLREDVNLEVGTATESVTVTAEATLLKTENSEMAQNVTVDQIKSLPVLSVGGIGTGLSSGFRDPFALATMVAGVSYVGNSRMVINGTPDDGVQFRVEGQTAGNTGGLRQFTQETQPSVDAIEEVAVQTSNFAAEFGTTAGGVVNVAMKSGTNRYSGSVYDYAANEVLDSHQPYSGVRNATRRHDYGFTLGGPVRIPKVYDGRDKTFFFWNWEQFRENANISTIAATVPTEAYRGGDFSALFAANNNQFLQTGSGSNRTNYLDPLGRTARWGAIFDANTERDVACNTTAFPGSDCNNGSVYAVRDPFPGNMIPASRFDPVSQNILALVPLPQGPGHERGQLGNNFQRPWLSHRTSEIPSIKVDQILGSSGRLSFYYQQTDTTSQFSFPLGNSEGFPTPVTNARGTFIYSKTYRLNYDHTLSPTTLLHLGIGWNQLNFADYAPVLDYNPLQELGLPGATLNRLFPRINSTDAGTATGGMESLGPSAQSETLERRPAANTNVSWVRGNHTLKIGGEWREERFPARSFTSTAGLYSFGNSTIQTAVQGIPRAITQGTTGFNFASFLMGDISSATLAVVRADGTRKSQWSLFAQDTWKLRRNLTLDLGLRWDYGTYAREDYGRNAAFSLTIPNPSAGGHPGGQVYEATCNCNFASNYPYAIGPRIGVAYQIDSKTVLRSGFGIVYTNTGIAAGSSNNSANTGSAGFGQTFGKLQDGIPGNVNPQWPNFVANNGHPVGAVVGPPTFLDPNAGRPAKQYQWSIGLQREISRNLVVETSYVANRGVWWSAGDLAPLNVLRQSDLTAFGFTDFTSSAEAGLLTRQVGQLNTAQRSTLASRGITIPYSNFPTNQTVRQSILPFPQYGGNAGSIEPTQAPLGKTWYDALQFNLTQRFTRGLSLNANYTFSKNLDLIDSPDPFNRQLGKDLASTDLPHRFRLSAEYQIPNFSNSGIPFLSNRVVSYLVGDWGIGWYLQYQSAGTLGRPGNRGSLPISQFLGYGPGPAQLKLDSEGNPMSPWSVDWVDYDGNQRTDPIDVNCHCFDPTKTVVLNPDAWENIPNGSFGAQQTTLRYYRGIRQPQENLNLSRNFRFGERTVLHIRAEFQNIFNRTRLPQPNTTSNYTQNPTRFTTGSNTGLYSGGFGTLVPVNGTNGYRTGLLIGRLTF